MHEEDSSSVNDNFSVLIENIEWTSAGILKICFAEGPSFFIRDEYYLLCDHEIPVCGKLVDFEKLQYIKIASSMLLCETITMRYLAQREHTRFQLVIKLEKKGYKPDIYNPVLDRVSRLSYLDDARFAEQWIRSRFVKRLEGRSKVFALLLSRGVCSETAKKTIDSFFENENEKQICEKALVKLLRLDRSDDSMVRSLHMKGFSFKIIKECMGELHGK